MAIVRLNPVLESIRGAVGDVVFKQYGTKLVISRKPVFRNRTFSPAQKECQDRFRQAALFAQQLMADPTARKLYEEESRVKGKPVRSLMIADFLHARLPEAAASGQQETNEPVQATGIGDRHVGRGQQPSAVPLGHRAKAVAIRHPLGLSEASSKSVDSTSRVDCLVFPLLDFG